MDERDYSEYERSVSSKDQLNYRTTIQLIVNRCLFSMGRFEFATHVKALRFALYFQIPGLPFKDRIDNKLEQLEKDKEIKIQEIKDKQEGRKFYSNVFQAKLKIDMFFWYWETLLKYLLDLLAEHDALMKPKGFVESGRSF